MIRASLTCQRRCSLGLSDSLCAALQCCVVCSVKSGSELWKDERQQSRAERECRASRRNAAERAGRASERYQQSRQQLSRGSSSSISVSALSCPPSPPLPAPTAARVAGDRDVTTSKAPSGRRTCRVRRVECDTPREAHPVSGSQGLLHAHTDHHTPPHTQHTHTYALQTTEQRLHALHPAHTVAHPRPAHLPLRQSPSPLVAMRLLLLCCA